MNKIKIAPSILSADFAEMCAGLREIETAGADYVHCDVMDGQFVPNISFGMKMIADIKKRTALPLDVHLMITEPRRYAGQFIDAGADLLTIHAESEADPLSTVKYIKSRGIKAGVVIKPKTPISALVPFLEDADLILIMSVEPGFGGQAFDPAALERLEKVSSHIKLTKREIELEVDGGINFENVRDVIAAGANVIVAGSTFFNAGDKRAAVQKLRGNTNA